MFQKWILFIFLSLWLAVAEAEDQTESFLAVSDIHFDPLSSCKDSRQSCPILTELLKTSVQQWDAIFSKYHTDIPIDYYENTSFTLLRSTFSELKYIVEKDHPAFVIILGDSLDHHLRDHYKRKLHQDNYQLFVKKIFEYLTFKFNEILPNTNIYPVVGNVDTYGADYIVIPNGEFLRDLSQIWKSFIKNDAEQAEFVRQFQTAGYYAINISATKKIIALNTVLFSPKSQNNAVKAAARQQLNWLSDALKDARMHHQSVLILCHIPAGIDIYLTSSVAYKIIKNFWRVEYSRKFLQLVYEYSDVIKAMLAGHLHIDLLQFTLQGKNANFVPVIITPSISPIFGNNPAMKIYYYNDQSFQIESFERYYLPISEKEKKWQESKRFSGVNQASCSVCYLKDITLHLIVNNYLFDIFTHFYSVKLDVRSDGDLYSYYWCSIYSTNMEDYKDCINNP